MSDVGLEWLNRLKDAEKKHRGRDQTYITCASLSIDNTPKISQLAFRDFLSGTNLLVFSINARNSAVMALMKGSGTHELFWAFPDGQSFTMTGRIYVVSSPRLYSHFGTPKKSIVSHADSDGFWESQRLAHWKALSKGYRASFTWPVPGDIQPDGQHVDVAVDAKHIAQKSGLDAYGFRFTSLDYIAPASPAPASVMQGVFSKAPRDTDETNVAHTLALDQFCLLVFKPLALDYSQAKGSAPSQRQIYSIKHGKWVYYSAYPA
ncbi:hypothetical protein HDV03_000259 [Kappamyces sp. JEL0829]|nr:hypothetical protein HDV03_000259 [Kappamyces sp. JEL0829]